MALRSQLALRANFSPVRCLRPSGFLAMWNLGVNPIWVDPGKAVSALFRWGEHGFRKRDRCRHPNIKSRSESVYLVKWSAVDMVQAQG